MSGLVIASARTTIADYVWALVIVYFILIAIRVLMSWFTRIPYYPWLDTVLNFVRLTGRGLAFGFTRGTLACSRGGSFGGLMRSLMFEISDLNHGCSILVISPRSALSSGREVSSRGGSFGGGGAGSSW